MAYLYAGKILFIDLSKKTIRTEPTRPYAKLFLGGRGINIKLLYDNIVPGSDALGPDNVLVFGVGPLGGTSISTGRTEVTAKSPQTGLLGSSNFGGYFAGELKYAGYDHIVTTGRSDKPVYIWIDNQKVEIRDASAVWGKDAYDAPDVIRREVDNPEAKIACIGPAGENLVRFATIQHELGHSAGRTGLGTVMGSKNLKAIAVRGTKGLTLFDPEKFLSTSAELEQNLNTDPMTKTMGEQGLAPLFDDMATGNGEWGSNYPKLMTAKEIPKVSAMYHKYKPKRSGCYGCPVQCMDHYQVDGVGKGVISCELYPAFTYLTGCFDADTSLACSVLCQRYGVDCDSTGETIRWLMELYENRIIDEKDTDGIPMEWGSPEAIRGILDKIVFRQGIGDILADGMVPTAKKIGRGSEFYANHVKGLPMFEGSNHTWMPYFKAGCLSSAVGPRGDQTKACVATSEIVLLEHKQTPPEITEFIKPFVKEITGTQEAMDPSGYKGKPEMVEFFENVTLLCDMLSTCKYLSLWGGFMPYTPEFQARLFSAGSGRETSIEDLFAYALRVRTMERVFEVGEGLTREKDTLPKRFFDNPVPEGDLKGAVLESAKFEKMKSHYYEMKGWDPETGIPTEECLTQFGLNDVAEDLQQRGILVSHSPKRDLTG